MTLRIPTADNLIDCPGCKVRLTFSKHINIRGVDVYDPNLIPEAINLAETRPTDPYRTSIFTCAGCGRALQILFELRILEAIEVDPPLRITGKKDHPASTAPQAPLPSKFTPQEEAVLQQIRGTKFLEIFTDVVADTHVRNGGKPPRDIETFFLHFLRSATKLRLPFEIYKETRHSCYGGYISYWAGLGIGVILRDGMTYRFVPARIMRRATWIKQNPRLERLPIPGMDAVNAELRRRGLGYVPEHEQVLLFELIEPLQQEDELSPDESFQEP